MMYKIVQETKGDYPLRPDGYFFILLRQNEVLRQNEAGQNL